MGESTSTGSAAGRNTARPADMPQCLPHPGEINSAVARAKVATKQHNRRRRLRLLAYFFLATLGLVLMAALWIVHLNFGLMFNRHASYREATKFRGVVIWHQGVRSEFVGTQDKDGFPITGVWRSWDENGTLSSEDSYEDGAIYGTSRTWNNGVLESEFLWEGNVPFHDSYGWPPNGVQFTYRDGILRARQEYRSGGRAEGSYEEFDAQGNLVLQGQVKASQPIGDWRWLDANGRLLKVGPLSLGEDRSINTHHHGPLVTEMLAEASRGR